MESGPPTGKLKAEMMVGSPGQRGMDHRQQQSAPTAAGEASLCWASLAPPLALARLGASWWAQECAPPPAVGLLV